MSEISNAPDVSATEVPIDAWTQPFWDAAEQERLVLPHCSDCGHFRWPPGPFCPKCHSQQLTWAPAGTGRIYSFTVIRQPQEDGPPRLHVPALIEFPDANGVRLVAAIVDTPLDAIRIGVDVTLGWSRAANATLPVFRLP